MIKKLLALVLSLMLAFGFAGCSSDRANDEKDGKEKVEDKADKKAKEKEEDPEKAATAVAENFMDALVDFDYDTLQELSTDPELIPEDIKSLDSDVLMEELEAEETFGEYTEDFQAVFQDMIDNIKDECSYEITDVEEDNGSYIFKGVMTTPDFDTLDLETYVNDAFSEEKMTEIALELYFTGQITEDMTDEEIEDVIYPALIDYMDETLSAIDFSENIVEEEFKIVVVKVDGEWLVDTTQLD